MRIRLALVTMLAAGSAAVVAQTLWAPKGEPAVYRAPHKPHIKVAELRAKHKGHLDWRQVVVDDEHLRSEYIQAKAGTSVKRALHPDTRTWWVVLDGEVRFNIETVEPFVAKRGSMVQAPMQTFFSWEVVGDKPALIFETNIAGARTLYESDVMPPKLPGLDWAPVRFNNRKSGVFEKNNKPHVTFDEVAAGLESGKLRGTIRIVEDARGAANFIYGYNSKLPPVDEKNKGHYHPECAEYWLIMKGQIRYPIEKAGVFIADEGDVIYVPRYTYHAPRWWGEGASCRLAMNGYPDIAHLFEGAPGTH
jgi:mannose-6-phosphate isomerase-like protein (cupin superfamily)